ncbi:MULTISPECIES: tRNA uridine-5-carboxymethylaminomethyl(34) synthesis GTPase MnmE [Candidatus Ichthyocystis]|uniref:tRNA uridine-5-carboxymethylaminomethyl(34) synthesis GTPase MnmE n=1 Tax=Candidatus Ichthyocystis TaxID=2929841 RepID=UPI000B1BD690|nr:MULTISPECIES: tRNA uridine-5-carboxymethylaminomethyl(34) synthesis GTPase MnmE [Ichthyocystis]
MIGAYYHDTIAAISTPHGSGAISIVRVSGDNLGLLSDTLFKKRIPVRKPVTAHVYDEDNIIDSVIVLFFRAPHSYTGEDIIEIHCHGGLIVTHMVLDVCLRAGSRLADPGEFTLRSYYNNKMDLAQAEAISDIINAQSEAMVRAAAKNIAGLFTQLIKNIKEQLIYVRTYTEALIDFPEEDITFPEAETKLLSCVTKIEADVMHIVEQTGNNNILNSGPRVVIIGNVNAGKSSLINAILRTNRSIVSNIAGTTRDTIEERLTLGSNTISLIDTAGLNENSTDAIEQMGIEKSFQEIAKAHIILVVIDITDSPVEACISLMDKLSDKNIIIVLNKVDRLCDTEIELVVGALTKVTNFTIVTVSTIDCRGLKKLRCEIQKNLSEKRLMDCTLYINKRHESNIYKALSHITSAKNEIHRLEIFADELRLATKSLEEIIGTVSDDHILTEIFSKFCIGK